MTEDWYTARQAAKILGLSPRRVQQLAKDGDIEGEQRGRGWRLAQWSVHAYLERHGRPVRGRETALESPDTAAEWVDRVADLERQLGRLEGRLELTETAESTLREALDRERERATTAEQRAERLENELLDARKPWYRRWFGGG